MRLALFVITTNQDSVYNALVLNVKYANVCTKVQGSSPPLIWYTSANETKLISSYIHRHINNECLKQANYYRNNNVLHKKLPIYINYNVCNIKMCPH